MPRFIYSYVRREFDLRLAILLLKDRCFQLAMILKFFLVF